MSKLAAFVGHSFSDKDKPTVREFLDFFDKVERMSIGFSWEHAEPAAPEVLSKKVLALMADKNIFIGICTAHERAIQPEKLVEGGFFQKDVLRALKDDFRWKASNWMIQEIGVAIGKNMSLILLLEDGVEVPGGLQGNLEYISFNRAAIAKAFPKILEMLTSLKPMPITAASPEAAQQTKKHEDASEPAPEKPLDQWTQDDFERAIFAAIFSNDAGKEKELIRAYASSGKNDEERATLEALSLRYRQILGKGTEIRRLEQLSQAHPANRKIAYYLAQAYEEYKDFQKAADLFEKCADITDISAQKISRLCDAAIARSKAGTAEGEKWLMARLDESRLTTTGSEAVLLKTFKELAELRSDFERALAYAEAFLELRPDDIAARFSMAYSYSEQKRNDLALFHYQLIPYQKRNDVTWNNIGVAFARLGLPANAVAAYRKSEEQGGTLAMSNLAHILVNAGFVAEAQELCDKAVKRENYDKHIGTAIALINEIAPEEEDKQSEQLKIVEPTRRFYIEFGKAGIRQPIPGYKGIWKSPECELEVVIEGQSFFAKGSYEKIEAPSALSLLGFQNEPLKTTTMVVQYVGTVIGQSVTFHKSIVKEGEKTSLLNTPMSFGLMVIDSGLTTASVYVKADTEPEFYTLTAKV